MRLDMFEKILEGITFVALIGLLIVGTYLMFSANHTLDNYYDAPIQPVDTENIA
tara:strand:- start:249 stop:410 length:162 start_codon:yes stop_codon:yes gene_type:complete